MILTQKKLIGVRDPFGVRPLVIGRLGPAYILASETCALDIIGATYERDVEPGEVVVIDSKGLRSEKPFAKEAARPCVFELIYFARPDSISEGMSVYEARKKIGHELARESHVPADLVVPVPDSGVPSALGYSVEAGIPFELGIIRNHYVGRTFIEPTDSIRHLGVRLKHNANRAQLEGRRVILVDDSIVRGTTSRKIVEMVRNAGATEVHMRISSPPTTHSCFYGIDTPERSKLLAAQHNTEEMAKLIGADSLAFISLNGLYRALGHDGRNVKQPQFCDACFNRRVPDRPDGPSRDRGACAAAEAKRGRLVAGRLAGRLALVTGASRGIGAAVAKRFAAEGADLILVARTTGGLEETDDEIRRIGGKATLCPLDLADVDAIDQMAISVAKRWGKLDVLVANAAVLGVLTPTQQIEPKVWDQVMAVNVTANWRLLRAFDPLLRASEAGRAMFVTSGAARGRLAYWAAYAASKAALEALVTCYAAEIEKTRVRANIVDPGVVRTGMRADAFPDEDPMDLVPPEAVVETFVALAESGCRSNGEIVRA